MSYWKLVGLAGLAGVAAVGVVATRRRRSWVEPEADELRARLHRRLQAADAAGRTDGPPPGQRNGAVPSGDGVDPG